MAQKERMELANMFQYVLDHYEEVGPRVDYTTKGTYENHHNIRFRR